MTTETMTIHKALSELKVLDNRISLVVSEGVYCTTNKCSNQKIGGIPIEDYKKDMQGSYDKATDLINRRNAIKRGVVLSNAVTTVKIDGVDYTIAEAIEMKNHAMENYVSLLGTMSVQYKQAQGKINKHNESVERDADDFVEGLYGNKESSVNPDDYEKTKKDYIASHSLELVDPLDIGKKIEALDTKINTFMSEVDAVLSESNALTTITIGY